MKNQKLITLATTAFMACAIAVPAFAAANNNDSQPAPQDNAEMVTYSVTTKDQTPVSPERQAEIDKMMAEGLIQVDVMEGTPSQDGDNTAYTVTTNDSEKPDAATQAEIDKMIANGELTVMTKAKKDAAIANGDIVPDVVE